MSRSPPVPGRRRARAGPGILTGLRQLSTASARVTDAGEILRAEVRRDGGALPALAMPVIVLGGMYGGVVTTVTESAALSAVVGAGASAVGLQAASGCRAVLP